MVGCKKITNISIFFQGTTLFVVLVEMKYLDNCNQKAFSMR